MNERVSLLGHDIVDKHSTGIVVLSSEHAHIHEGDAFSCGVSDDALASGSSLTLQLTVPDGLHVHLKEVRIYTTGSVATLALTEAPTFTTGSNAAPVYNRNRASDKVSQVTAFDDPSGVSDGTVIESYSIGSGGNQAGGSNESDIEWDLNPGTTYIITLENGAVGAEVLNMRLFWYEHMEVT